MVTRRIERGAATDMPRNADALPDESGNWQKVSQRDRLTSLELNAIPYRGAAARRRVRAVSLTRCGAECDQAIADVMAELSAQAQALGMGYD